MDVPTEKVPTLPADLAGFPRRLPRRKMERTFPWDWDDGMDRSGLNVGLFVIQVLQDQSCWK